MLPSDYSRSVAARLHSAISALPYDVPCSPLNKTTSIIPRVILGGVVFIGLAQSLTAATYTWARGVANTFSWNNNATFGATNGNNWNASPTGAFPNATGDVANLTPGAGGNAQIYRLGQNITVGALTVGSGNSGNGSQTLEAGGSFSLIFDNGVSNSTLSHNNTTAVATISAPIVIGGNGTLTASNASASTGNLIVSGEISGSSSNLTLTGGHLTLTGANSYTGTTTVSTGGTLRIGNAGTTGSLSSSGSIVNNGTLLFNRTNTLTQGTDFGAITTGSGAVQHVGSGTLILNTSNTYSGGTVIGIGQNSSVLRVSASDALGSGLVQFDTAGNGSTARLELRDGITLSNAINLPQRNTTAVAIQNISGENTLSGLIRISAGGSQARVQSDDGALVLSGGVTTDSTTARNLYLQGDGDGEVSGIISNNQSNPAGVVNVVKEGGGAWILSGANTTTGTLAINAGSLFVNGSTGSGAVTVASGATIGGSGTVGGAT